MSDLFDETVETGGWGNYVRVRERRPGGTVELLWSDRNGGSGYDREKLDWTVRNGDGTLNPDAVEKALDEARNLSLLLAQGRLPEEARPAELVTLGEVLDAFREQELSHKSEQRQDELRRDLAAWEGWLGRGFLVREFAPSDWTAFQRARTRGEIDARGNRVEDPEERRTVGPTTAGYAMKALRQVFRWAAGWRVPGGRRLPGGRRFLLAEDPTRGLDLPREPNPARPVATEEILARLLEGAVQVRVGHGEEKERPPLHELLVLAARTGRRIGAIVRLRWNDWQPDHPEFRYGALRWRADSDKIGREWIAPVGPEVREVLEKLRRRRPGIGGAWIFPAPESGGHLRVDVCGRWLREAEKAVGLWENRPRPEGFGWHAFRRMWATQRKHLPAQDVAATGGWADTATLQGIYQQADPRTMEQVALAGGGGEAGG